MAEEVSIVVDPAQAREVERLLADVKNGAERAFTSAVNKTAQTAATRTRRRLAPLLGVKLKDLKRRVIVKKPKKMVAMVRLTDFNIKAITSKEDPNQKTEYAFFQKGELHPLPAKWFEQIVPATGHGAFFVRSENDASKATRRLPIQELFIRSPRKGWENSHEIATEETSRAMANLSANVMSQVDRLLNRKKADR